jgi:hypothetical protein
VKVRIEGVMLLVVALVAVGAYGAQGFLAHEQVSLEATLLGLDGLPLADTTVRLDNLVPGTEGSELGVPVAEATTDARGVFSMATDPSSLRPDGTGRYMLELETVAAARAAGFVYDFQALPPAQAGDSWRFDLPPLATPSSRAVVTPRQRVLARSVSSASTGPVFQAGHGLVAEAGRSAAPGVSPALDSGDLLSAPPGEDGADTETPEWGSGAETLPDGQFWSDPVTRRPVSDPAQADSPQTSCASGESTVWLPMDKYTYGFVPTKWAKTQGRATFSWVIAQSQQTELQIAVEVAGEWSATGMAGSIVQDSSLTMKPEWPHGVRQIFYIKWEFNKQQKACYMGKALGSYRLDVFRWMPYTPTGGSRQLDTAASVDCGGPGPAYHDPFAAPTTLTRNTTVTFSDFFTLAGIQLDTRQTTGSSQAFTIKPDAGKTAHACGNDASPMAAHFAKENGD